MTEMIERAARAIRDNIQAALPDGATVDYEYAARAVLEALRELTRDVIQAMETAVEDSIDSTTDTNCTYDVWEANGVANAVHTAMIDAALGINQPPPYGETPEERCERWAREKAERER